MSDELKMKDADSQEPDQSDTAQDGNPPGTTAPTDDLAAELEQVRAQAAEYLDGWQRARADFTNFRKRTEREKEDSHRHAAANVLEQFLPVLDDLERALQNVPEEFEDHTWTQGVRLIGDKFHVLLDANGLVEINPQGEPFDPNRHEAVGTDDNSDVESGHVTVVLQKGYACGDRVLRPALVRVAN